MIESVPASPPAEDIERLAEVLHAAVHAGASVSFVVPFSLDDSRAFWRDRVLPHIAAGTRRVLIARLDGKIAGTVQLDLATPPNQRHPAARRRGIARALMLALEEVARAEGRTLLTLDTRTGDRAEPLYLSLGYVLAGIIPRYARAPHSAELEATTVMYKE